MPAPGVALAGLLAAAFIGLLPVPVPAGPLLPGSNPPEALLHDGLGRAGGFEVLAHWSERIARPHRECRFAGEPCVAPSAAPAMTVPASALPAPQRRSRSENEDGLPDLKAPRPAVAVIDAETLVSKFAEMEAPLVKVRLGEAPVPRIFLSRFPHDLAEVESVKLRKSAFIHTVLPLVLQSNHDIRRLRVRLLELRRGMREGLALTPGDRRFLAWLADEYEVEQGNLDELVRRVDVVPPSLALAQGAEESGWGTSRFARRGNAVFGQRTFREGRGMVPLERTDGEKHEVLVFDRLETSVRAYMWNLNTHPAYDEFRRVRAGLRRQGQALDSDVLIGALSRYSERGEAYIETIRTIMHGNELFQFDQARLAGNVGERPAASDQRRRPPAIIVPITF